MATSNVYQQFYCNVWAFIGAATYPIVSNEAPIPPHLVNDVPQVMLIACQHVKLGRYGLTQRGQVTNAPALVPAQSTFTNIAEFPNGIVDVTLIKDIKTGNLYYCDTTNYTANFVQCNTSTLTQLAPPSYTVLNGTPGFAQIKLTVTDPNATGYVILGTNVSTAPPPPPPVGDISLWGDVVVRGNAAMIAGTNLSQGNGTTFYWYVMAIGGGVYAASNWAEVTHTQTI